MTTLEPSRPSVSSTCERHPDQPVTGFCADCLRERLVVLDQLQEPRRKSTSSAVVGNPLRAIFRSAGEASRHNHNNSNSISNNNNKPSSSSASFLPELRRCKSFSAPKAEGFFSGLFEPQRKSCDVRGRSTLSSLFHLADETAAGNADPQRQSTSESTLAAAAEEFQEIQEAEEEIEEEGALGREEEDEVGEEETKTMKDHIDLDAIRKTTEKEKKEIAGGFWGAASVFSKKLQSWRRKQKAKKAMHKSSLAASVAGDAAGKAASSRRFRDTQSEVADYGYGRRSCDTDPRFSLDAGRISLDDPRFSFDEPRASWDGYLIGAARRDATRFPTMLSVMEDPTPPPPQPPVPRFDTQIPVEEARQPQQEDPPEPPGGTAQTREYYSDSSSSSRRKKNLEKSGSVRKTAEIDETKPVYPNAKVTPTSSDYNYFSGNKLVGGGESKDSSLEGLRDDCWESFDSVYRDGAAGSRKGGGGAGGGEKKSRRWGVGWNIWGLIHRRSKEEDDHKSCRANSVIDRSFSESWPELRREANGELRGGIDRRVFRCNSSVSSRGSWAGNGGPPAGPPAAAWGSGRRKKEEAALERNRSARYSPGHFDNGLLRFYLTPLRGSRRNGFGVAGKLKSKSSSNAFARSMLRLY